MSQPLPPPINPHQMDILRAVTAMAWADGQLEPDEIRLMLDEFASLFAKSEAERESLKLNLREYLGQNIPLEEVIPHLRTVADRKLVLKLGYQVIQASRRNPNEPKVNMEEAAAYQRLVRLLGMSAVEVAEIETEIAVEETESSNGLISSLVAKLHHLMSN